MTKIQALETLIRSSDWLTLKDQNRLVDTLPELSEDEVTNLGKFFTAYLKKEAQELPGEIASLDKLLDSVKRNE